MSERKADKRRGELAALGILTAALTLILYLQFLLLPQLRRCSELSEKVEENSAALHSAMTEIGAAGAVKADNEDIMERLSAETEGLFSPINTDDADILLLGYIEKAGLSATALSVSRETDEPTKTGVRTITAEYTVSGGYDGLVRLISDIAEQPAIAITDIYGSAKAAENGIFAEDSMEFQLCFKVYMYEPPVIPKHFSETEESGE